MKLKDKVALITGAGSGFGMEIALQMAQEGAKIAVNDVNPNGIEGTLSALKEIGSEGLALQADVGSSDQVKAMFEKLRSSWGTIDILVNNAGIGVLREWGDYIEAVNAGFLKSVNEVMTTGKMQESMKITSSFKDEWWQTTLNVHVNGTFYCTREALKIMEEKRGGKIINLASICGITGCPGIPAYSAAKGAIMSFTKSLAKEVIGSGITVNAVAPGYCETPILEPLKEEVISVIISQKPIGRLGTTKEIASLVVYLATDEANFIVGQVISPNGGMVI